MKPLIDQEKPSGWNNPYGYWPKGLHWELLKAIYLEDNIQALETWAQNIDIEAADTGMLRLLPLLYRRLSHDKNQHAILARLKSKYRFTLYRNNLFLHRLRPVIDALDQAGIDYVFIKGLSMIVEFYQDLGLRPMNDWDISVPFNDYQQTCKIFSKHGFKPQIKVTEAYRHVRSSQGWSDKDDFEIDLHWRVLPGFIKRDPLGVWENKKTVCFKNMEVPVPPPEVSFISNVLHGLKPNPVAPIRWIADCIEILDTCKEAFDWNYAFSLSRNSLFHKNLKIALQYIQTLRPDLSIPERLIANTDLERIKENYSAPKTDQRFWPIFVHSYSLYTQTTESETIVTKLKYLPQFIRYHLSIEDNAQLSQTLIQRLRNRFN